MRSKQIWAEFRLLVLLLASLASSCEQPPKDLRQQIFAFGTHVELVTYGGDPEEIRAITARIETRYAELDRDWYPWERDTFSEPGELRRINSALASGKPILVSSRLSSLIRRATQIEQLSQGKFNPGIGLLIKLWGFDNVLRRDWEPPSTDAINELMAGKPGSRHLKWQGNMLSSQSQVTQLDLGGIAKGAILEITVALLREGGVNDAIINIGGDLTVLGTVHGREARIGIQSPVETSPVAWLDVADGETVVTSGDYERYFEFEGQRYQHILDPDSGFPVRHTASVTVVHTDSLLADAAATAMMVGGMAEFDEICRQLGIDDALLIGSAGDLRLTPTMQKRVNWSK